jgi:AcrR family transcriptional regulator
MLEAMVDTVAEKGYPATTIADVVARAAVSRRTFYEQFRDKEECFLAAFEVGVRFLRSRVEQELTGRETHDWQSRVRVVIETYLATLASEPEFAKVLHVDVLAAGERARARWAEVVQRSVAMYRTLHQIARDETPGIPEVTDEMLLVVVGGIPELVREYVRTGRIARLPELAPQLTALVVATLSRTSEPGRPVRRTGGRDQRATARA